MSYDYQTQRSFLFTDDGQRMFLKIRDHIRTLLHESGAVMMEKAMGGVTGDTWHMLACVDRLVELGELEELDNHWSSAGQHRVFIRKGAA